MIWGNMVQVDLGLSEAILLHMVFFFLYLGQRSFTQIVHSNRDLLLSSMVDAKVWLFNFWLAEVSAPLTASEPGS
jgi:hypothetical protein